MTSKYNSFQISLKYRTPVKVSIVMCTYNGEEFIKEQLDSLLKQTYPIHEIIIQDDASTDKTWEILRDYKLKNSIIRCYRNDKNIGVQKNFITAYLKTSGDYIAPCDQDDIWAPNKIEFLINIIGNHILAHSQSLVKYANSEAVNSFDIKNPFVDINTIVWDNRLPGHGYIFRRDILKYFVFELEIMNFHKSRKNFCAHDHIAPIIAYASNSYVITKEILQVWRRHLHVINKQNINSNSQNPNKTNGYLKAFVTFFLILIGEKSIAIEESFKSRSELITFLINNSNLNQSTDLELIQKIAYLVSEQTLASFIRAGIIYYKVNYKIEEAGLRTKLAKLSFYLRFPFTYWYDNRSLEYL